MSAPSFETFGKYVLLEKLATGGMAEVFLARGSGAGGIGKFFAIKRILPQHADSPEFIDMFKDEAKIAINLNHSNIVSIHEFGVEKGQFFLVMDYVEGRNLRQIQNKMKKTSKQFSIDQVVYMIKEVSSGLDHAHRCIDGSTGRPLNITHRDISPQNIMVSFEGEVKIVDFGIAKAESQIETTRAGTLKGKFGYMSPEQAEGQPVDLRTDIFSLGIVMWELLAHDRLFVANNEINTLRKIRDCQVPSLRKINPNIHAELERIVQKALARDRNLRYQTGAALQRDLNRFLNRQYPDFSAQDFSVFTKEVFADEILSLRKRLVEYTKLNIANTKEAERKARRQADDEDSTSILETDAGYDVDNTDSSEVHELRRPDDASDFEPVGNPEITASDLSLEVPDHTGRPRQHTVTQATSTRPVSPTAVTAVPKKSAMIKPRTAVKAMPQVEMDPDPSAPAPKKKAAAATILDHAALESDINQNLELLENSKDRRDVETEEISSPSIAVRRAPPKASPKARRKSGRNGTAHIATILVFVLICMSAYAYLVKYFTPVMAPVISMTDPYLGTVHDMLGVVRPERQPSGVVEMGANPSPNPNPQPNPIPPPNAVPVAATPTPVPTPQPAAPPAPVPAHPVAATPLPVKPAPSAPTTPDPTDGVLVVTSNPSGAEILVNDQASGVTTPNRVQVPTKGPFSIIVRKRGYRDYRRDNVTHLTIGHRLDVDMQKQNVGYVDVEIFPPQEAIVYVAGKRVELHRNMARDVVVPGNSTVQIRAESPSGSTYDEATLTIGTDHHNTVKLNPRRLMRKPANTK